MAQGGVVLGDLFSLSVTSGVVGVLEGKYFALGDASCRPHHPLLNPEL